MNSLAAMVLIGTAISLCSATTASAGDCRRVTHTSERLSASRPTILSFKVEPDGSVKDVSVTQSSGNPDLDEATSDCVAARHVDPAPTSEVSRQIEIVWNVH